MKLVLHCHADVHSVDTALIATSNTEGWPHVQHRGGPRGFIRVLSGNAIAFNDHDGNKQFISLGNISENAKVCLTLMDFERRARLKVWGRASVLDGRIESPLNADAQVPTRHVSVNVHPWDFNCSKHIVQRFAVGI